MLFIYCLFICCVLRNFGSCVELEECKLVCCCKFGYVRDDNGICILEEECFCYYNGLVVFEGYVVKIFVCEIWLVKFIFVFVLFVFLKKLYFWKF